MTDTATETQPAETKVRIHSTFGEVLGAIEPQAVRDMIVAKLDNGLNLTRTYNKTISQIQESSKNDPESTEYQDDVWKRVIREFEAGEKPDLDPAMVAAEKRYQKAIADAEKQLAILREGSKAHMDAALSDEEIKEKKKDLNESKNAIVEARNSAKVMAEMADQLMGAQPGTTFGLMPEMDSMVSIRGKRTSGGKSSGGAYITRIGETTIDGEDAGRDGKYALSMVARKLSERFNFKAFAQNAVTPQELEEAMYKAAGIEVGDKDKLPEEIEFDFQKDILVQNSNDDSTKTEPQIVKLKIKKYRRADMQN